MAETGEESKPHAVVIPCPAQSHIKGMLKLARLLHHKGFYITFVNTEFNHKRLLKARGPGSLNGLPNFQFKTIPDGLPPSDPDATQDVGALCASIRRNFLSAFQKLLSDLNDKSVRPNSPSVTCIVSDGVMPFTAAAAKGIGVPLAVFWTLAACGVMGFHQYRSLLEKGLTGFKGESILSKERLEAVVDWIPGMNNVRLKDLPSFFRTTDPDDDIFNWLLESTDQTCEATAFGIHTFDPLEPSVLNALSLKFPHVHTIGPLQLLLDRVSRESPLNSLSYSLWTEDPRCLKWLDTKAPGSVVYVNFGSITVMSNESLIEFAWGLANSTHTFLWVVRPDLVTGNSAILPPGFERETRGRSLIAWWCAQEEVLNHPAVGGFLTHCGWNSVIESLSAGLPMLCWPFFGDQQMNCRFCCTEWGVGMEIDSVVKRDEVEKLVRELMDGEKGMKLKEKAIEWKKLAQGTTGPGGSSSLNLDKFVSALLRKT